MTDDLVLSVRGLSKKHAHQLRRASWYGVRDVARELALRPSAGTLRPGEFWALQDVDLELRRGEALAVVGANGAGKSTLLKLLAGLFKPDRGEAVVRGRTAAIIELGAGFNPLLSGLENIRLAAALHGLSRREEAALAERVLDFSGLGEFITDPVQSYSSGMRSRLAYSLSAHLDPDLMLVDEALAVGDHAFQRKCIRHMQTYLAAGGALVLVSHNSHQIQAVCGRGLLLERGRKVFEGSAIETMTRYFESRPAAGPAQPPAAELEGPVAIEKVTVAPSGETEIRPGTPLRIGVCYRAREPLDAIGGFAILTEDQNVVIAGDHRLAGCRIEPGAGEISCIVRGLRLVPGRYAVRASLIDRDTHQVLALFGHDQAGAPFDVRGEPDLLTNHQMRARQLVTVDVEWAEP